jgi:hypothetical protein
MQQDLVSGLSDLQQGKLSFTGATGNRNRLLIAPKGSGASAHRQSLYIAKNPRC